MEPEEKDHGSGFLIGLLVGGIVGAAVAYFATADKEERGKIFDKGKQLIKNVQGHGEDIRERGIIEVAKEKAEEVPDTAREAVKNVQEAAQEAIVKITQAADKAEMGAHKEARKFFVSKGKVLVKK